MKIIGLTGGIASGKSTVANALKDLGAIIIEADKLAHQIIEPDKPAYEEIIKTFGQEILNDDLTINRDELGKLVFNNPEKLEKLNNITHPRVIESFKNQIQAINKSQPNAVVVFEIPLLYEINIQHICDEVWVVWIDRETQIERLKLRDGFTEEEAIKRIDSQMSLDEKAKRANRVIDNRKGKEETIRIATKYYNEIL
ncbi:Dephospho-CoA kinase [Candidatus Syntrophocurvum alkaliphilum]|uniref:Dephospho-CoA kinase n=1 Tax=Candidatus Syntrophocurvum alkaliphilum TaxID=2293317 RepID=A0A6I6DGS6_9FIRM|nr:dephospho-CoA kinase [Candidatus Syntrophocurvum alkaliphilum]QGU00178.1 Dephospho-CoA kinase [Candidatus Syntrophocurvum alkaliphilum]